MIDWRTVPGRYIKDPRLGHRLGRNYGGGEVSDAYWNLSWLGTDRNGLVHNGNADRDYELGDKAYRRVFVLGGSTVMGLGVSSNRDTISAVLERRLRETIPNARVANCAVGSYMSWQQVIYLTMELIGYEPDLLIVVDGCNDYVNSTYGSKGLNGAWRPNTHQSFDDVVQVVLQATGYASLRHQLLQKLRNTHAYRAWIELVREWSSKEKTYVRFSNKWEEMDYTRWSIKPESVKWYIHHVRSTIGLARANGAKVIYLMGPQLVWGDRKPTVEEQELIDRVLTRMPPLAELAPRWYALAAAEFNKVRQQFHDGSSIWIEDAGSWLNDIEETVYHDWNHYNKLGQQILGERLADTVMKIWQVRNFKEQEAYV